MATRTWVDGAAGGTPINANNLNGIETDITTALGVPDAALKARIADQTSQTAAQLSATYARRGSPLGSRRQLPAANLVDVLMTTPPIIGAPSASSAIAGNNFFPSISFSGTTSQILTDRFTYTGGGSFVIAGTAYPSYNWVKSTSLTTTNIAPAYNVSFLHDGTALEVFLSGNGGQIRVRVDGQLATLAPTSMAVDGNLYYLPITFSTRAVRRITLETSNVLFGGVKVGGADSVNPVLVRGPRTIVMGDSFTEGSGSTYNFIGSWSQKLGVALGWDDVWPSGVGGTGYLNPGVGGRVKFRDRLTNDVTSQNPQVVIWAGGINDFAYYTQAAIQAEAIACYQAVQAAVPGVTQIVFSPWWRNGAETFPLQLFQARDALKAAVTATTTTAQPVYFVDVLELPIGSVVPATTLAAAVIGGATTLSTVGFIPQGATIDIKYDINNWERKIVTAVSGSGPYTITVQAIKNAYSAGTAVKQVGPCWWTGAGKSGNRLVTDGATTATSTTITSATAAFVSGDVGRIITGNGIPANTTIASVTNGTTAALSANATATATAVSLTITNQTGIGNSDYLVYSDGTHPSNVGHDELGRFAANLIAQTLMDA